ncbi:putative proton-dependent oligopeptide transporter family, major facilitator superfamily [Rosa chinensis]|uniref:Putative proton-dependent oligopeptide transporter family, major facilitator superfamily n=1 Tax=Rosa chinensis TaxID=74649 RepID=A0A2P6QYE6_ROSCH|nr:putative proton-dependent oligopeptide transporter family, major facilitator superfamily [Rosa chinensis]
MIHYFISFGLVILWSSYNYAGSESNASDKIFYGAGLLLALGEAGRPAALGKFLEDQYLSEADHKNKLPETRISTEEENYISTRKEEQEDPSSISREEDDKQKRKRVETRQAALWSHPWFIGAAAPLALVNRSWPTQLLLSMIAVGVSYLLFWYGVFAYSRNIRNESNDPAGRDTGLCPAIKSLSPSEETASWKSRLKPNISRKQMLVMCLAFIVYSLVEATGNTFFFDQMNLLDYHIGNFEVPIIYFVILESLSSSVISFLWRLLVPNQSKSATLVRIGCGLVCSVLCMVAAWQVEIRRKIKINTEYTGDDQMEISMSILWLIPQFSLLGFMRGLAEDGLIEFCADRVDGNDKREARYYGSYASELVLGIGTLLTAVSIVAFRRTWLANDIFKNRLDKYYRGLVFIGVANLCYYFCVAVNFYTKGG